MRYFLSYTYMSIILWNFRLTLSYPVEIPLSSTGIFLEIPNISNILQIYKYLTGDRSHCTALHLPIQSLNWVVLQCFFSLFVYIPTFWRLIKQIMKCHNLTKKAKQREVARNMFHCLFFVFELQS